MIIEKCDVCKNKLNENYNGLVWYSADEENNLCRSCHLKWVKSNICKDLEHKHKLAKPTTKAWYKKCDQLQIAFNRWKGAE